MWTDLDRPPLRPADLARAPWREVRLLAEVDSTNAVAADAARAGEPEGLVVVAEHQTAGRGRLGREWVSPPQAGLTFSLLLRPELQRRALMPLLVATAVADGIEQLLADINVRLKWPNDLLVGDCKLGGLLSEAISDAVVVGVGVNVHTSPEELPEGATSLAIETDTQVDRLPVFLAVLRAIDHANREWDESATLMRYRDRCATIGRGIHATLPGGTEIAGRAVDVDANGALVLDDGQVITAADVAHVR